MIMRRSYMNAEKKRIIFWVVGIMVLVNCFVAFYLVRGAMDRKEQEKWFANIQSGDVLLIETDTQPPRYSFIRLIEINDEDVSYYQSPWDYDKLPKKGMKLNDYFVDTVINDPRENLDEFIADGRVVRIFREYPADSRFNVIKPKDEWIK